MQKDRCSAKDGRGIALVVEDDVFWAQLLGGMLRRLNSGLQLEHFADAESALARLEQMSASGRAPELMVTDYRLPGMDGLDFAQRLRGRFGLGLGPAAMVSGWYDPRLPQRALQAGLCAFVPKRHGPAHAAEQLNRLCRRQRARRGDPRPKQPTIMASRDLTHVDHRASAGQFGLDRF